MTEFYIPAYSKKEGFEELKWKCITGREKPVESNEDGSVWNGWKIFYLGKDVFTTKEEAIEKSKELRNKKIAILEKQIAKLKSFG